MWTPTLISFFTPTGKYNFILFLDDKLESNPPTNKIINSERSSTEQERDESIVERTVRATNHVREALLAGYTTYRDLGTEAMDNFDANFRDCINRGIIPGPRLFIATHALASTSSYEIRSENRQDGHVLPRLSDTEDGPWCPARREEARGRRR